MCRLNALSDIGRNGTRFDATSKTIITKWVSPAASQEAAKDLCKFSAMNFSKYVEELGTFAVWAAKPVIHKTIREPL